MMNIEVRQAIVKAAQKFGYEPIRLMAVIEVESAGRVFWSIRGQRVPVIRPEGHYFHRLLKEPQRSQAVAAGLAWPRYSPGRAPRTWVGSWDTFHQMAKINEEVAIMSCSWGLGQVMGSDFRKLGFPTARAFKDASFSLDGQIDIMMRYIDADNLRGALNKGGTTADSWRPFARGYNGSAYARLGYHKKMATAYRKYLKARGSNGIPIIVLVDNKEQIQAIQKDLAALGFYKGPINGKEDKALIDAITRFQHDNGLEVDGLYGPMTERRVAHLLHLKKKGNAETLVKVGGGGTAIGAAGEKIIHEITPLKTVGGTLETIVTVLIIAGVCLTVYGILRRYWMDREDRVTQETAEASAITADEETEDYRENTEDFRGGDLPTEGYEEDVGA